jgi:flagellar L-ring protein FlgH
MKKTFLYIFSLIIFCGLQVFSQNMTENVQRSLFADHKATQVGDAVTIIVVESSSAENNATTKASRDSKIGISGSASTTTMPGGSVNGSGGTGNNFAGSGSTSSKGTMNTKITAKITEVDENGNLKVEGKRILKVNDEKTTIKVVGFIRPGDILPDNSIYSYKISDAEITFEGDGIVTTAQGPGWITKLLRWLF